MKIYGGAKDIYWIFIESVVEEREGSPLYQFRLNLLQKLVKFFADIVRESATCTVHTNYRMKFMQIFSKMRKLLIQEFKNLPFSK